MTDAPERPWYETVTLPALLRHARDAYGGAMRAALEAAGFDDIPGNGLYVIGGLALSRGEVPLGDLIADLRLSKQAAGQLVDALVLRGYLERRTDPADRRKLVVTLTDRGQTAAAEQGAARESVDRLLEARVGADGVLAARRALAVLCGIARDRREAAA